MSTVVPRLMPSSGSPGAFRRWARRLLGDADHGWPEQAIADHPAALHDVGDVARRQVGRRHLEHRLVAVVVELLAALGCHFLDAVLVEGAEQGALGELDAGKQVLDQLGLTAAPPRAPPRSRGADCRRHPRDRGRSRSWRIFCASSSSRVCRRRRFSISAKVRSSLSCTSLSSASRSRSGDCSLSGAGASALSGWVSSGLSVSFCISLSRYWGCPGGG